MASPELVGFSPSERIPENTLFRLTYGESLGIYNDDAFAPRFAKAYDKLTAVARVIPTTPPNTMPSRPYATIDGMSKIARTGADLVTALETVTGLGVELRRAERLQGTRRAEATSPAGAVQRDRVTETAQKDAESSGLLGGGLSALNNLAAGMRAQAKMVLIILVIAAGLWAVGRAGGWKSWGSD